MFFLPHTNNTHSIQRHVSCCIRGCTSKVLYADCLSLLQAGFVFQNDVFVVQWTALGYEIDSIPSIPEWLFSKSFDGWVFYTREECLSHCVSISPAFPDALLWNATSRFDESGYVALIQHAQGLFQAAMSDAGLAIALANRVYVACESMIEAQSPKCIGPFTFLTRVPQNAWETDQDVSALVSSYLRDGWSPWHADDRWLCEGLSLWLARTAQSKSEPKIVETEWLNDSFACDTYFRSDVYTTPIRFCSLFQRLHIPDVSSIWILSSTIESCCISEPSSYSSLLSSTTYNRIPPSLFLIRSALVIRSLESIVGHNFFFSSLAKTLLHRNQERRTDVFFKHLQRMFLEIDARQGHRAFDSDAFFRVYVQNREWPSIDVKMTLHEPQTLSLSCSLKLPSDSSLLSRLETRSFLQQLPVSFVGIYNRGVEEKTSLTFTVKNEQELIGKCTLQLGDTPKKINLSNIYGSKKENIPVTDYLTEFADGSFLWLNKDPMNWWPCIPISHSSVSMCLYPFLVGSQPESTRRIALDSFYHFIHDPCKGFRGCKIPPQLVLQTLRQSLQHAIQEGSWMLALQLNGTFWNCFQRWFHSIQEINDDIKRLARLITIEVKKVMELIKQFEEYPPLYAAILADTSSLYCVQSQEKSVAFADMSTFIMKEEYIKQIEEAPKEQEEGKQNIWANMIYLDRLESIPEVFDAEIAMRLQKRSNTFYMEDVFAYSLCASIQRKEWPPIIRKCLFHPHLPSSTYPMQLSVMRVGIIRFGLSVDVLSCWMEYWVKHPNWNLVESALCFIGSKQELPTFDSDIPDSWKILRQMAVCQRTKWILDRLVKKDA